MEMKVFECNGTACVDSRESAELLKVRHGNLITLIQKLIKNNAGLQTEFHMEMQNTKVFRICMTETGCKAVADFKLNNAKANKTATKQFILAYHKAFNQVQTRENNTEKQSLWQTTEIVPTEVKATKTEIQQYVANGSITDIDGICLQNFELNGQRVLTSAQLAEVYGTNAQIITNNFNRNKERYLEKKHFYCLTREELKAINQFDFLPDNVTKYYLWTEYGALLHAKSLNTDKAWEVYEKLVEFYFSKKEAIPSFMIDDPVKRIDRWIEEAQEKKALMLQVAEQKQQIVTQNECIEEQKKQITVMTPKADFCDEVLDADGMMTVTEIAKDYGKSAIWLNKFLHEKGVQFKQNGVWHLYQKYAVKGYAMTKTTVKPDKNGIMREHTNTYWNQRGRMFIHELLKANNIVSVAEMEENQGQLVLVNS